MKKSQSNLQLIIDGHNALREILLCIQQAQKSIHIRMFMWKNDEAGEMVLKALEQKIKTTPSIMIIIEKDAFGSRVYDIQRWLSLGTIPGDIFSSTYGEHFINTYKKNVVFHLQGSRSFLFFKILKENDHSKVYVFDTNTEHATALIGGMNIANEYLTAPNIQDPSKGGWHDYMVKITGESATHLLPLLPSKKRKWISKKISHGIEILFNIKGRRRMRKEILKELSRAKKTVVIEHGYITDEAIIRRLRHISRQGIKVTVILPDRSDGVFNANMHTIKRLLHPAVIPSFSPKINLYLYRGMIHAKVMILDNYTTIIGSANLTFSSLQHLNETNIVFRGRNGITKQLQTQIQKDILQSKKTTFQTIPSYNPFKAFIEKFFI